MSDGRKRDLSRSSVGTFISSVGNDPNRCSTTPMRCLYLLAALTVPAAPTAAQDVLLQVDAPNPEFIGNFGDAVGDAGDVDGDGVPDLLVGSSFEDVAGLVDAGRAYLFSGASGDLLFTLQSPQPMPQGNFGDSVLGLGDLTGDGVPDFVVGASSETPPGGDGFAGRVHAFSGADGTLIYTAISPTPSEFGGFGVRLAASPDLSGDGIADFLAAAPTEHVGALDRAGRVYAVSGADGTVVQTYVSPSAESFGRFGVGISGAGDLDADGVPDLVAGTASEDDGALPFSGRAHVLSGATGAPIYTFVSPDPQESGLFGEAVVGGRDLSGDGVPDLLVGAPEETPAGGPGSAGQAHLFSGADGAHLFSIVAPGGGDPGARFGAVLTLTGDLDADGLADMLITAPRASPGNSAPSTGRAYTFSGADGAALYTLRSPGEQPDNSSLFGEAAVAVADVDGDAIADFLLGAPGEFGGRAYLFSGQATSTSSAADELSPSVRAVSVRPNPFRSRATLAFESATQAAARFVLYDVFGRRVTILYSGTVGPGLHHVVLDAAALPAGVYLWRLTVGQQVETGRITRLR